MKRMHINLYFQQESEGGGHHTVYRCSGLMPEEAGPMIPRQFELVSLPVTPLEDLLGGEKQSVSFSVTRVGRKIQESSDGRILCSILVDVVPMR